MAGAVLDPFRAGDHRGARPEVMRRGRESGAQILRREREQHDIGLRRQSDVAVRETDGSWTLHPDHLEGVTAHEARAAEKTPVRITTLTSRDLDTLPRHDGAKWLDRELTSSEPVKLEHGFGAEVRRALG